MAIAYNQENILITQATVPQILSHAIWWYPGCEGEGIYAEIVVEGGGILFRVDGGDPYSSHCMYGLQYVSRGYEGDVIKLENFSEMAGFKAVKENDNCLLSVIYYKL